MSRSKDYVILCLFYTCVDRKNKEGLFSIFLLLLLKFLFQFAVVSNLPECPINCRTSKIIDAGKKVEYRR